MHLRVPFHPQERGYQFLCLSFITAPNVIFLMKIKCFGCTPQKLRGHD